MQKRMGIVGSVVALGIALLTVTTRGQSAMEMVLQRSSSSVVPTVVVDGVAMAVLPHVSNVQVATGVHQAYGISANRLAYTKLDPNGFPREALFVRDLSSGVEIEVLPGTAVVRAAWRPRSSELAVLARQASGPLALLVYDVSTARLGQTEISNPTSDILRWTEDGAALLTSWHEDGAAYGAQSIELSALSPEGAALSHVEVDFAELALIASRPLPAASAMLFAAPAAGHRSVLSADQRSAGELALRLADGRVLSDKLTPYWPVDADHTIVRQVVEGQFVGLLVHLETGLVEKLVAPSAASSFELPWPSPLARIVTRGGVGYNGTGHSGANERFAYDFGISVGDRVLASAAGTVWASRDGVTCNTGSPACGDYRSTCSSSESNGNWGNTVIIAHTDSTYTKYTHLVANSIRVTQGQTVPQGYYIAKPGHTGRTIGQNTLCGDHLHFQRQTYGGRDDASISTSFVERPASHFAGGDWATSQNDETTTPPVGSVLVSQGLTVSQSTVQPGHAITFSFTLWETSGTSVFFDTITVAILNPNGTHRFDTTWFSGVTVGANLTWSASRTATIDTGTPAGQYRAVVRGRRPGGDWFDFGITGSGTNPRFFDVSGVTVGAPTPLSPGTSTDTNVHSTSLTPVFAFAGGTGASRYGFYISREPYGSANIVYQNESIVATSFQLPSGILQHGVKYRWNMVSFSSTGTPSGVSSTLYFRAPDPPCSYSLVPSSVSANSNTTSGTISLSTGPSCPWTAVSNALFAIITSASSGVGSANINYLIASNSSSSARAGSLTIGGRTFSISQAGRADVRERILLGVSDHAEGGWIAGRAGAADGYRDRGWTRVPWSAYNATGKSIRMAAGDVDGDGLDEIVIGLKDDGWFVVLDDAAHDFVTLRWLQVPWPAYNAVNGEVWPAVGDVDGDGRDEIVVGLGQGGGGWFAVFNDASASFALLGWHQVQWPAYNASNGSVRPAVANVDGSGSEEIVLGLGIGSEGWVEVFNGASAGYSHRTWLRIPWPAYNASNGETYVSAGDLDGDGRAEIVAGLGAGGRGYLHVFDDASAAFASRTWLRTSWPAYNDHAQRGETRPSVGDLDNDGRAEIVVGLGPLPGDGGWFEVLDDQSNQYRSQGWWNVGWPAMRAAGGSLFPVIGRFR